MVAAAATIIRPQSGPQEAFLASSADIVIYGGAASGGKIYEILAEPLGTLRPFLGPVRLPTVIHATCNPDLEYFVADTIAWPTPWRYNLEMNEFEAGHVVKLNSGGPAMTIRRIEKGEAHCEWFVNGEVKRAGFVLAQLKSSKPDVVVSPVSSS